jgi:hypothetical protein
MRSTIRDIGVKIALAAMSGYYCSLVFQKGSDSLHTRILIGLLFAGGVLFPYLRWEKFLLPRTLGLTAISAVSFELATTYGLQVGNSGHFGPAPEGYITASFLGAAMVLTGARFLIPLKHSLTLVVTGLAAAVMGGLGFVLAGYERLVLGFILWHSLMTLAIYVSENWSFSLGRAK